MKDESKREFLSLYLSVLGFEDKKIFFWTKMSLLSCETRMWLTAYFLCHCHIDREGAVDSLIISLIIPYHYQLFD